MFAFVSGRPSLDLVGTLKWRRHDREEQLVDTSAWRAWVRASGLEVRLVGPVDDDSVNCVRAARESLYGAFAAAVEGHALRRADLVRINTLAAGPGPEIRLDRQGEVRRTGTVDQVLTALVHDAFDVLGGAARTDLRECANPRCTRLFIDSSRARARRWCGMTECGNQAKVAAFRARSARSGQS